MNNIVNKVRANEMERNECELLEARNISIIH